MGNPKIDKAEILGVTIELYGERTDEDEFDLGALTLKRQGREYILDVVQSYTNIDGGFTTIETDLQKDEDTFDKCPYDLTDEDLMASDLVAELFVGGNFAPTIEHITLFVRFGGENGMTKAINVIEEK